jgi:hypothetical protein
LLREVEDDRDGPQATVAQTQAVADSLVVPAPHESPEGGEPPAQQQLQVAELAWAEVPARPLTGLLPELPDHRFVGEQVYQRAAVGWAEVVVHRSRLPLAAVFRKRPRRSKLPSAVIPVINCIYPRAALTAGPAKNEEVPPSAVR